jgi:hypothetical protein
MPGRWLGLQLTRNSVIRRDKQREDQPNGLPVTVLMRAALIVLLLSVLGLHETAVAQQAGVRMVIATYVACRAAPDVTSPVAVQYQLGDVFLSREHTTTTSGVWYLDTSRVPGSPSPGCWIHGDLTTEWLDREQALLAAVNRMLDRTDTVPFEDFVAMDNLLQQTRPGAHASSSVLASSPLLQLRRIQVLERATRAPGTSGREVRRDPLKTAWFLANQDILRFHEPAGSWVVTAEVFWQLHDQHSTAPIAEDMAWNAAQGSVPGDECDAVCVLDRLNRTYARYWAAYPRGQWVSDAIAEAQRQVEYGAEVGCFGGSGEEAVRLAQLIRLTLRDVTVEGKQPILDSVAEIERRCDA